MDAARKVLARSQRGATAIEFALVFPLLFILFYSMVVYSYLFVLQESITYAAQEAAAAAHRVNPVGNENFNSDVATQVSGRLPQALAWLSTSQRSHLGVNSPAVVEVSCSTQPPPEEQIGTVVRVCEATNVVTVTARFRVEGIFPKLDFPLLGSLPPMPTTLVGSGTALVGEA